MKKFRFTEDQIVSPLKESEAGAKTPELCRKHGISPATPYKWKSKVGGLRLATSRRCAGSKTKIAGSCAFSPIRRWRSTR